jgi:glucose/arabinose dehydrogenase
LPDRFSEVTLADGLDAPTAVAYAPDGQLFIAEQPGRLRVVSAEGGLRATPVLDISSHVNDHGDRGLLGLALDASFATNGLVYLTPASFATAIGYRTTVSAPAELQRDGVTYRSTPGRTGARGCTTSSCPTGTRP